MAHREVKGQEGKAADENALKEKVEFQTSTFSGKRATFSFLL